jgi:hypothetical protein
MNITGLAVTEARHPQVGEGASALRRAELRRDGAAASSTAAPGIRGLVARACAVGGVLRDTVYVTFDALSGRYDH